MEINGREIALQIYPKLRQEIRSKGLNPPRLVVLLIGDSPTSHAYVRQKQKWGEHIGAIIKIERYPTNIAQSSLEARIKELNIDPSVDAILLQLPLPKNLDAELLTKLIVPSKDIDGFAPNSKYNSPLGQAVMLILQEIKLKNNNHDPLIDYLRTKRIVILGKGKTGGMAISKLFTKQKIRHDVVDSKTIAPEKILKEADILISAVGKAGILQAKSLKPGVILIGIGMQSSPSGVLQGDYKIEEVADFASYYTPIPGGVGPVNVACLLANLVSSVKKR